MSLRSTSDMLAEPPRSHVRVITGDSRRMTELADTSVDLAITSPPYWHIKDYAIDGQIGYGQTLHEYLRDLYRVWQECFRVLRPARRLCVNIGDQFARQAIYGRYKVIPLHAEIIAQCEESGFDYLGSIIWQKKTTMETSGGAVVMGSYPHPPNGIVELDYEYILLFKKPGPTQKVDADLKERSRLTREEWKEYFSGHWYFGGARQQGHEAMFPEELPRRLIRMFSFAGETVLDPFLGSGTTAAAALKLGRSAVGYEINPEFVPLIEAKLGGSGTLELDGGRAFSTRPEADLELPPIAYQPRIQDARPQIDPVEHEASREPLYKVVEVAGAGALRLHTGETIGFLGVRIDRPTETLEYLDAFLLGKQIYVRTGDGSPLADGAHGYIYLKNRIFVNAYLIRSGLGSADPSRPHRLLRKLQAVQRDRETAP